jgi:DNA-binding FadR family transcriptional regulator
MASKRKPARKTGKTARTAPRRGPGRRLHGALLRKLGVAIVTGKYKPGSILTDEVAFAEELQVSRGAYREALQALTSKGLVERRPKAGTRVLPRRNWNLLDPEVLGWFFVSRPDMPFVRNLFELRQVIEPAAARLAAERRSEADLRRMKEALALMRLHTLATEQGRMADRDFHMALLDATRNEALVTLSASIASAVTWTTRFKQRERELPRDPIPDHERVFRAVAAGNAQAAARAMAQLLELAFEDTRISMEPQPSR